jgi:hypothetical protein
MCGRSQLHARRLYPPVRSYLSGRLSAFSIYISAVAINSLLPSSLPPSLARLLSRRGRREDGVLGGGGDGDRGRRAGVP